MEQNEKLFVDYMYTNYILKDTFTVKEVNEAYRILYNSDAPSGCNQCLIHVANELKLKYVLLKNVTGYSGIELKKEDDELRIERIFEYKKRTKSNGSINI